MVALNTPPVTIGWKARDFRLKGTDGKFYTLDDVKGPKGLVVMFICNHCPYVKAIAGKLTRDMKNLAALGVGSIAVMANDVAAYPDDSFDNMVRFAKEHGFPFPYVIDTTQEVAKAYDAVCTPDFFGFDGDLKLQYRGRLDSAGMKAEEGNRRELFEAMNMVAKMGKAPTEQNPSIGCSIKWRDQA
jgi:peroxiredoxin